jgi:hypothetical protein
MILFGMPAFLLGLNALADNNKPTIEGEFSSDFEGADDE